MSENMVSPAVLYKHATEYRVVFTLCYICPFSPSFEFSQSFVLRGIIWDIIEFAQS